MPTIDLRRSEPAWIHGTACSVESVEADGFVLRVLATGETVWIGHGELMRLFAEGHLGGRRPRPGA